MWKTTLIVAALVALIGCSRGTDAPSTGSDGASMIPAQTELLPSGPAPAANPDGTPNPVMLERLIAEGVEPDEARFLALTTYQITQPAPDVIHLVMTYPWGDVQRIGIHVRPIDASEVKPFEVLASSNEPDQVSGTYRYSLNLAELPPEAFAALTEPARGMRLASLVDFFIASAHAQELQPYSGPNAEIANATSGWLEATYAWAMSKMQGEARNALIKKLVGSEVGGKVTKVLDSVKHAEDLTKLSDATQALLDQIDKLRKCAENPTAPMTKERYEQNPDEQKRLLDAIDAARAEIVISATAVASGTVGKVTSSTGGAVGKALGIALGPLIGKTKAEIEQQMKDSVQRIKKMVVPCTASYRIESAVCEGGGRETMDVCDVTKPFSVTFCGGTSTVSHTPAGARGGTFSFEFKGGGGHAANNGTYTLSGRPDEQLTATYVNKPVCFTAGGQTHCHAAPPSSVTWTKIDDCED